LACCRPIELLLLIITQLPSMLWAYVESKLLRSWFRLFIGLSVNKTPWWSGVFYSFPNINLSIVDGLMSMNDISCSK
jgi:hypothetical protein